MIGRRFVFAILVALQINLISGFGTNYWKIREQVEEHRDNVMRKNIKQMYHPRFPSSFEPKPLPEMYFTQPMDHFDPTIKETYQQRYFVNKEFWKTNGPVFLYIGGEGAISSLAIQGGETYVLAKQYGALMFAVEHRFYGKSINEDGLKLSSLQYLSSQQALADLASFHRFAEKEYGLTEQNTWVCFGGSYPGALSAWFRLKYPHLVYGAIASSAPVRAKANFEGYNSVVAESLATPLVNGSEKCALAVQSAFKTVDTMLDLELYSQLETDFKSCGSISQHADTFQFVSNLADPFMGTVQYNDEGAGYNITSICDDMLAKTSPYQSLKYLYEKMLNRTEQKCADNSWDNFIKQLSNTTVVKGGGVGIRQWLYQTCTQFGYYQSCDANTTCIFSHYMDFGHNIDICQQVYGVSGDEVFKRVEFTNSYYGGDHPRGTRIVFVNGSIDPWHALSILQNETATETAIYIKGTAHCANMHDDALSDLPALRQARKEISDQIGAWLKEANGKKDTTLYFV